MIPTTNVAIKFIVKRTFYKDAKSKRDPLSINRKNAGIFSHVYTPSGSWNMLEPALTIIHADGNTSSELLHDSYTVQKIDANVTLTTVVLKDPTYAVEVTFI